MYEPWKKSLDVAPKAKLEICLPGNCISKKNSKRICRNRLIASKAFLVYEKEILAHLMYKRQEKWPGKYPVFLHCFFYRKTKAKFDYSNMVESVQDLLVKAGIIEDDSYVHVVPVVDGMAIDKEHPRTEITIKGEL